MLDFNLEYYRAFYYVAQLKSITKAANALFLSQPAVTRSIKQLEKHLHCSLFQRNSRGMQLTHEGGILLEHVSKAFDELLTGEKKLALDVNYVGGKLEIGATETALHHFLLPKIEQYRSKHPKIYIHVSGSSTPEILRMLRDEKVDLVIGVSPVSDTDGLEVARITDFSDIFIAGPRYTDLSNQVLSLQEISEYPIATVEKGTSARNHIDHWFEGQGLLLNPEYSVRTTTAVLPFVERNLAIGIVPSMFAQELISSGKLFEVQVTMPMPPRHILMIYKDDSRMPTLCREFIKYLSAGDEKMDIAKE